jgi:hypothetical protein
VSGHHSSFSHETEKDESMEPWSPGALGRQEKKEEVRNMDGPMGLGELDGTSTFITVVGLNLP